MRIINGTITDNNATGLAGGIQNAGSGTITLHNTILAGNTSGHSNQDFRDSWGSLAGDIGDPSSYNLIGVAGTGSHSSGITDGVNENVVGTAAMAADPLLTPLGDYGGNTPTHKPNPFGPAGTAGSYEIATAAGLYADQRGNLYSDEPVPQMSIGSVLSTGASASQFPLPPELIEFTP